MSTSTPDEQDREVTLGHLSQADLLALIKRMVQLYPDLTGLIEPVQQTPPPQRPQRPPFNSAFYRHQVNEVFRTTDRNTWGSEARAANPLLDSVDIADEYGEQRDFNNAATLYEIIIRGILDTSDSFRWHAVNSLM
jgi:hypothetical protein